jgi:hypothetical protein
VTSSLVQGLSFQLSAAQVRRLDPANPRGGRILQDYRRHQEETTSEAGPRTVDQHEVDRIAAAALNEILHMSPRLIVAKPELYAEFRRIKGEREFRDAILLPLPVLAVAVCVKLGRARSLPAGDIAASVDGGFGPLSVQNPPSTRTEGPAPVAARP